MIRSQLKQKRVKANIIVAEVFMYRISYKR